MELGEAEMDRIRAVLGPVFPVEAVGKGGNMSNQAEVIKARLGKKGGYNEIFAFNVHTLHRLDASTSFRTGNR